MSGLGIFRSLLVSGCTCAALLACAGSVRAQQSAPPADPAQSYADEASQAPGRVARLAYLSGQVQFAPAGENDWGSIDINRPMVIGDRLLTGEDGRAVLELGDAAVRIDHGSAFDFLNLDDDNVQIELSQGTLNLAVRRMEDGENFEVDTPTIAFVASTPGVYRIDDSPNGDGSMVTVFRGSGTVYGENGASREVVAGSSYRFNDSALASVEAEGLPRADDFDRFCETRDTNYERYTREQREYVPPEMIGGDDLYSYGQWDAVPEYGNVWYPRSVPVGWAPYRYGHWAWIDPWGWTWVDNQPWGFAPFHYGRWVHIRNRWGWVPGPVHVRPVYAPALVAFVGGSGFSLSLRVGGARPVGWFPLGPRDVYVPWFHASRRYFTNVNVTNIRHVYVNKTVINHIYNDYSRERFANLHRYNRYAYRKLPGAVTAVPRNVFTGARPVHPAVLKLDRSHLARVRVAVRPGVDPGKASLGLKRPATRPAVFHGREPFARPVVARHAPPARPVGFAARQKIIASQHGQPLTREQMQNLRKAHSAFEPRHERVKLVGSAGKPAGTAAIGSVRSRGAPPRVQPAHPRVVPRAAEAPARHGVTTPKPPFKNTVHPIPARNQPVRPVRHPSELPSARFVHPSGGATLPRVPVIRPAGEPQRKAPAPGRLPVVRPVERVPQSFGNRSGPRQVDIKAQQGVRVQRMQPLRPTQGQQVPQRIRAPQAQQPRNREQSMQRRQAPMRPQRPFPVQPVPVQMEQRLRIQQPRQQHQAQQVRMPQIQGGVRQRAVQRPQERHTPRPGNHSAPPRRALPRPAKHPGSSGNASIR